MDILGQVVDVGIPDPVEDTNPLEESRTAPEGSHEEEILACLRGQSADLVGEGSIGESTVAAETLVGPAEVVGVVVGTVAAVDFAGSAGKVVRENAAVAVGSELVALMKEYRSDERSAY